MVERAGDETRNLVILIQYTRMWLSKPHCGSERQDDWHFVWGCPCLETCSDARIQKSNWLKGEAWRYKDTMPCLYLRGLTPKASTHRNVGAVEVVTSLPREVDGHHPSQAIFLDGSGGSLSRDPRLRRCGWAWVQCEENPTTYPIWFTGGEYGTLPGR